MQEVYENIFMEALPLTGNPLKSINIFVVKTPELNMIVDTGFNNEEVQTHMLAYLDKLDIDLSKTVLFLTHLHSDHVGLASFFAERGIKDILMSRIDGDIVCAGTTVESEQWQGIIREAHVQGMDVEQLNIEDHPGFKHRPTKAFDFTPVDVGDVIEIGDFRFVAIDEAGHTPGMIGLYEPDRKILFCGDHILGKITPNITYWGSAHGDSLGTYLKNLIAIKELDVRYLFSSHRYLIKDVNARIDELLAHHDHRLAESKEILKKYQPCTVRDVTAHLSWDIRTKNWDNFPASQKWFAAGEAAAHLQHLMEKGEVRENIGADGVALYSLI